ncbi:MAG: HEAT repeat domain-containing protein [Fimbriimonas sp.]
MRAAWILLLAFATSSGWADVALDAPLRKLRHADERTRRAAAVEFRLRYQDLARRAAADAALGGRVEGELVRLRSLARCDQATVMLAIDTAEAPPDEIRERIRRIANRAGVVDHDLPEEPSEWICGGTGGGEAWRARYALDYVATRRPQIFRSMLADPNVRFKGVLLRALSMRRDHRDQAIAIEFLRSPKSSLREAALDALGELFRGPALRHVLGSAGDPNPYVRATVATVLPRWGGDEVLRTLLNLLDDPSRTAQNSAAVALRSFESPQIGATYRRWLDEDPRRRGLAALELAYHPDVASIEGLVRHVHGNEFAVVFSLASIDDPAARKALLDLTEDSEDDTRYFAVDSLKRLSGPAVEARLLRALGDPSSNVVSAALEVVAVKQTKSAIPILWAMRRQGKGKPHLVDDALRSCLGLAPGSPLPIAAPKKGR